MRILLATCLFFLALICGSMLIPAAPVFAQGLQQGQATFAQCPPLSNLPASGYIVLKGKDWLNGKGVDVFFNQPCGKRSSQTITPINTIQFQCVDLAARLYCQVGYRNNFRLNEAGTLLEHAWQLEDFARRTSRPQYDPSDKLSFYPNDGTATRPPAPGDLLVFKPSKMNNYDGHVAVVNRVAGDLLEYVQQNICSPEGQPVVTDTARIEVQLQGDRQLFRISEGGFAGEVKGWVNSERIKEQLIDQPRLLQVGDIQWNRDDTAVYVYLSPARTRAAALGAWGDQDVALLEFADLLKEAGALSFTTYDLAWQIANQVSKWIRSDRRLNPASGVRSVDFTLKYTGRMIWVRPWGGPANGKWIPFVMEDLAYGFAPAWKTPKAGPPE